MSSCIEWPPVRRWTRVFVQFTQTKENIAEDSEVEFYKLLKHTVLFLVNIVVSHRSDTRYSILTPHNTFIIDNVTLDGAQIKYQVREGTLPQVQDGDMSASLCAQWQNIKGELGNKCVVSIGDVKVEQVRKQNKTKTNKMRWQTTINQGDVQTMTGKSN